MSSSPPPHYTAFRLVLVAVVVLVLLGMLRVATEPSVWAALLDFLGLQ